MDLTEKILFYMKRYHMIPENKNIVVGLSGGADSVCLLYVLVALRKKLGLQLCAVHVHHGLRGVEADADEAYVRDICRAWDVPLKAMRIDAAALAKQWEIGCEEAGRRARYEIFEECLQEMGGCHGAIAVAHHRDDCAETLLFHMFRGTGLDGMAGIRPVRKTEREVSVKTESGADGEIHGRQTVPELHMTVFSRQKDQEIPKNQYTKWFDYDKIKGTLSVRTRRTGDYLILPSGGSKTIARYMIDEKIPKEKREKILLLAEGSHVLWVVGFRISEYYKIEEHTENILQVTCDGGKDYGR